MRTRNRGSLSSTSRRIIVAMPPRLLGPAGAFPMVRIRIGRDVIWFISMPVSPSLFSPLKLASPQDAAEQQSIRYESDTDDQK